MNTNTVTFAFEVTRIQSVAVAIFFNCALVLAVHAQTITPLKCAAVTTYFDTAPIPYSCIHKCVDPLDPDPPYTCPAPGGSPNSPGNPSNPGPWSPASVAGTGGSAGTGVSADQMAAGPAGIRCCGGGGSGGGGPGGGGGGGGGGGPQCCEPGGMPVWSVSEPRINLFLNDKPLWYSPSRGNDIAFRLAYKNRPGINNAIDTAQTNIFSVGTNWHTLWRSYLQDAPTGDHVEAHFAQVLGDGSSNSHLTNVWDYETGAFFGVEGTTTPQYVFSYNNGERRVYGTNITIGGTTLWFLTRIEDAQANATRFLYRVTNSVVLLNKVIDVDNRETTFEYTNTAYYPYQMSKVISPFGQTTLLSYNASGQLTSIQDALSLQSTMTYDTSNRLSSLSTTTYGTNTFDYYGTNILDYSTNAWAGLRVTEKSVRKSFYLSGDGPINLFSTAAADYSSLHDYLTTAGISETFDNANFNQRNSYFWGPLQYGNLSASIRSRLDTNGFGIGNLASTDYNVGSTRHWLNRDMWEASGTNSPGTTLAMEREPSPDATGASEGLITWYDHANKVSVHLDREGHPKMPILVASKLPGSDWAVKSTPRNYDAIATSKTVNFGDFGSPQWRTFTYAYASNDIDLTLITTPDGTISNSFNAFHQVVLNFNVLNEETIYTYTANTNTLTSIAYPNGLTTTYSYDANTFLTNVVDSSASGNLRTNSYTYTNGLVYSHTDERGLVVTNVYDALNRLTKTIYPDGTGFTNVYANLDLVAAYDRLGFTNGFAYDGFRQLIRQTNANKQVTTYAYCDCGSLTSVTDPLGNATSFTYDNLGRRTRVTYPGSSYVDYTFDSVGRLTSATESTGVSTTNYFNINGLVFAASNSFGRVFYKVFDTSDRTVWQVDQNGSKARFTYDAVGRMTVKSNFVATAPWPPDGAFDIYSWETFYYSANISPPTGHDDLSGNDQVTVPNYTSFAYDGFGRKTNEIRYDYLGGTPLLTNRFTYSPGGDLLTLSDGKQQITTWKYDQYGHVTNKLDANGTEMFRYRYDADGRLTNRWTPGKTNTGYSYDAAANLTKITYAVSTNITLKYDANNRLTNMVDAVGTTAYSYTSFGALLSEDGPWASDTVTYSYDNGRRRSGLNLQAPNASDWVQSYVYDTANRLSTLTPPAGTFTYHYFPGADAIPSPSPLVQQINLPNGACITNLIDNWGRLLSTVLKNSANSVLNSHSYSLNELNQRTSQTRTDGSYVLYAYDDLGQLIIATGYEAGGSPTRMHEVYDYGYDAAGNLTYRVENALLENFTVNNLNQLSNSTRSGKLTVAGATASAATSVTVADNGNSPLAAIRYADYTFARTNVTLLDGTNSFTAVAQDSLSRSDTNSVSAYLPATVTFQYDANGNLTNDGRRAFAYDDENQLMSVSMASAWKSDFVYDGKLRRRIRKEYTWANSAWLVTNEVRYVYDGNLVVQDRDANNLPAMTYTRGKDISGSLDGAGGIGGLLGISQLSTVAPQNAYYHVDGNGNVTMLMNSLQLGVAKYIYDPFGNTLSASGYLAEMNRYRFSSKEAHPNSGLVYYHYRYFEPNLQRWLNKDPLGDQAVLTQIRKGKTANEARILLDGSLKNAYFYVQNTPIDSVDAYGLCKLVIPKKDRDFDWEMCCQDFCLDYCSKAPSPQECAKACFKSCDNHDLPNPACLGKVKGK